MYTCISIDVCASPSLSPSHAHTLNTCSRLVLAGGSVLGRRSRSSTTNTVCRCTPRTHSVSRTCSCTPPGSRQHIDPTSKANTRTARVTHDAKDLLDPGVLSTLICRHMRVREREDYLNSLRILDLRYNFHNCFLHHVRVNPLPPFEKTLDCIREKIR